MVCTNKYQPVTIISWDWKDSPNFGAIEKAIEHCLKWNLGFHFIEIETNSDDYAVAVAPKPYKEELVQAIWNNLDSFYPDEGDL